MKKIFLFLFLSCFTITMGDNGPKTRLIDYAYDVHSQFGEDGVIEKIFEVIGTRSKLAVEFGAWDGFHLSNTANLWTKDLEWQAVLIESDEDKCKDLIKNTAFYNCLPIQAWVGINNDDCLETILKKYEVTASIDILSIDVDGNDYYIFESLKEIRPRLIVCEYNPTIPVMIDVYGEYSHDNKFGQSVAALVRIAKEKRYALVALTLTNAFFVREEEAFKFREFETDIRMLDVNDSRITLVSTYTGEFLLLSANTTRNGMPYGATTFYGGTLCGSFKQW